MNKSYLAVTGLLLLSIIAGSISAQGIGGKPCDIIQSRDYKSWSERLEDYERILNEMADSLSEAEKSQVSSYVNENWRRELFDPNSNTPENAGEERYAKRRACGDAMKDILLEKSIQAFPPSVDFVERTGGEIAMMVSLLVRFAPTCEDDFRMLALSRRALDVSKSLYNAECPFEY